MKQPINDGGPAFPHEPKQWDSNADGFYPSRNTSGSGMTLRDWFAGMALQGGLSSDETIKQGADGAQLLGKSLESLMAERSYFFADAMLAEREHVAENP